MTKKEIINSADSTLNSMIKIAGTNYDRRRKVTTSMRRRMMQMYGSGRSISSIADHFSVSYDTVKRTVDEIYNKSEQIRKKELNKRMCYKST